MKSSDAGRLMSLLLDPTRSLDERSAAARELGCAKLTDESAVTAALVRIAEDKTANPSLARSAGAGLARLRVTRGIIDNEFLGNFTEAAFWGYDEEAGEILGTPPWDPQEVLAKRLSNS